MKEVIRKLLIKKIKKDLLWYKYNQLIIRPNYFLINYFNNCKIFFLNVSIYFFVKNFESKNKNENNIEKNSIEIILHLVLFFFHINFTIFQPCP